MRMYSSSKKKNSFLFYLMLRFSRYMNYFKGISPAGGRANAFEKTFAPPQAAQKSFQN